MKLPYDDTNPIDIERYAKTLIGKNFREVLEEYSNSKYFINDEINLVDLVKENTDEYIVNKNYKEKWIQEKIYKYNNPKNKGTLGNLIEEFFFMYKPNSDSCADFPKANTELKVTPYEITSKNKIKAGERLVIGMISYNKPINPIFEESSVLKKLKLLLIILYLREHKLKERTLFHIDYVKLFSILGDSCKDDLEIIKEDYKKICEKIIQGKAHELSEGDTRYLGACTKGANAKKSLTSQYYSDIPAKKRAFSLKQSYMTYVINNYIIGNVDTYDSIFKNCYNECKDFDSYILNKLNIYKGYSEEELYSKFEISNCKNKNSLLINRISGVRTDKAEEFEKANIKIKTIRVKKNGIPKESMSFPTIRIKDFVKEEFQESNLYNYFAETRFLFAIFKEGKDRRYFFEGAMFWNMPISDLETIGEKEWAMYQKHFIKGVKFEIMHQSNGKQIVKNDLKGERETKMFHLRPHASKSSYIINGKIFGSGLNRDMDELLNGDKITKQCFWLNKSYIAEIIKKVRK